MQKKTIASITSGTLFWGGLTAVAWQDWIIALALLGIILGMGIHMAYNEQK